ncbi:MAG: phage portal protein, partial [Gemmatimonadota bacterium]
MTNLVRRIASRGALEEQRSNALAFQQWVDMINYNNVMYPVGYNQTLVGDREDVRGDFTGLIAGAFQANGIVFACMYTRMLHFSQMRFQFRQMRSGKPGALFGTPALQMLETPWPNGTTSDLLARMIQDVDLSGNSYIVRTGDRLARLRPDWVSILLGSQTDRESWVAGDPDTEVIGYIYKPGGLRSGEKEMLFHPERVAHFAPIPDPMANYRGMSWLTPLIREIQADQAMNAHRLKYFEQGATVNLVLRPPPEPQLNQDQFMEWVNIIRSGH